MKLSAVIITKNEEKMIKDCLESIKWVGEIILIDSGSTDETVEIAKRYGAKIVEYTSGGNFNDWRNKGAKRAKGDWILYVDADERLTPALRQEMARLLDGQMAEHNAYAVPRKNIIFGKEFKHGGQWPDYVKRLFKKSKFHGWTGELHEEPQFDGEIGHLKNPMIHIKHDNLSDMVEKTNKWSEIEADLMYKARHPKMNIFRFFSAGFREFWLRMVRQLAFLDGTKGIIYGMYQVYSRLISYAKLWEMQINKK